MDTKTRFCCCVKNFLFFFSTAQQTITEDTSLAYRRDDSPPQKPTIPIKQLYFSESSETEVSDASNRVKFAEKPQAPVQRNDSPVSTGGNSEREYRYRIPKIPLRFFTLKCRLVVFRNEFWNVTVAS